MTDTATINETAIDTRPIVRGVMPSLSTKGITPVSGTRAWREPAMMDSDARWCCGRSECDRAALRYDADGVPTCERCGSPYSEPHDAMLLRLVTRVEALEEQVRHDHALIDGVRVTGGERVIVRGAADDRVDATPMAWDATCGRPVGVVDPVAQWRGASESGAIAFTIAGKRTTIHVVPPSKPVAASQAAPAACSAVTVLDALARLYRRGVVSTGVGVGYSARDIANEAGVRVDDARATLRWVSNRRDERDARAMVIAPSRDGRVGWQLAKPPTVDETAASDGVVLPVAIVTALMAYGEASRATDAIAEVAVDCERARDERELLRRENATPTQHAATAAPTLCERDVRVLRTLVNLAGFGSINAIAIVGQMPIVNARASVMRLCANGMVEADSDVVDGYRITAAGRDVVTTAANGVA